MRITLALQKLVLWILEIEIFLENPSLRDGNQHLLVDNREIDNGIY
jgi:hypothetical protein